MSYVVLILLLALSAYAIERNHRRQARPSYTGSGPGEDRDLTRVRTELAAQAGRATSRGAARSGSIFAGRVSSSSARLAAH
ncbi:hypothetical protein [Amycolatopsis sp. YIM 10]|uniref:hypothetical protein n=1 Tax=Amycolatopsis sp. YIM 10 TaxID=2653857 RepID=UPI0012900EA4|nr:hypothetical protein [Amycolatopsis sp. YIM 10]QFU87721.1 hypothetical protein YIM_12670 [Amycolatopsis sp. YIM 10]